MRRWEIEIRNLADDFGLDKKDVDDAVKKAKRISVGKYEPDATRTTFRYLCVEFW